MRNFILSTSIVASLSLISCGKPEPQAFQITIQTKGKTAALIVPIQGGIICSKGLSTLPMSSEIHVNSEDELIQVGEINSAHSWNRTPDGRYTIGKDKQGNIVFRLININGNGTTALKNEADIEGATLESCSE